MANTRCFATGAELQGEKEMLDAWEQATQESRRGCRSQPRRPARRQNTYKPIAR